MVDPREAEVIVIGTLLKSADKLVDMMEMTPQDFSDPLLGYMYDVISKMYTKNLAINVVTVSAELSGEKNIRKALEARGGGDYLINLTRKAQEDVAYYANAIKVESVRNDLAKKCNQIVENLQSHSFETPSEVIASAEVKIMELSYNSNGDSVYKMGERLPMRLMDRRTKGGLLGISTGYHHLDTILHGLQNKKLYILSARSKAGKSCTMLNIVKHVSVYQDAPTFMISTEMSAEEEESRLLASVSGVMEDHIRDGSFVLNEDEKERVEEAKEKIIKSPIYHYHNPFLNVSLIKTIARKYQLKKNIKFITYDLIKLPPGVANGKEWVVLGDIAYGLKALAIELDIPILAMVQLNRTGLSQEDTIDAGAIAGSDVIFQAADCIMALRKLNTKDAEKFSNLSFDRRPNRKLEILGHRSGKEDVRLWLRGNFDRSVIEEIGIEQL